MRMKNVTKKKKLRLKPLAADVLFTVFGMVIGCAIAALTRDIGFLKWLSFDVPIGFEKPLPLTFLIFKIQFGFSIHLNPAVVLFGLLGLFLSRYLRAADKAKQSAPVEEIEEDENGYEEDEE